MSVKFTRNDAGGPGASAHSLAIWLALIAAIGVMGLLFAPRITAAPRTDGAVSGIAVNANGDSTGVDASVALQATPLDRAAVNLKSLSAEVKHAPMAEPVYQ